MCLHYHETTTRIGEKEIDKTHVLPCLCFYSHCPASASPSVSLAATTITHYPRLIDTLKSSPYLFPYVHPPIHTHTQEPPPSPPLLSLLTYPSIHPFISISTLTIPRPSGQSQTPPPTPPPPTRASLQALKASNPHPLAYDSVQSRPSPQE